MATRADFAAEHRQLLRIERDAEVAESERLLAACSDGELVARGAALLRLEVADLEPGFGGRLHAVLRPSRGGDLPPHRFGPGDVVAMRANRDDPQRVGAVVVRVRRAELVVALDDDEVELPPLLRLDRVTTDVTFRRLDAALRALAADADRERERFLDVLFGEREDEPAPPAQITRWFDQGLDESQRDAVAFALNWARDMGADLADEFVGMYVNQWTLDYGERGRKAVQQLLTEGAEAGIVPQVPGGVVDFVDPA